MVTKSDFSDDYTRKHLFQTMSELLALNIVPIVNTNDAIAAPPQVYDALEGVRIRTFYNHNKVCSISSPSPLRSLKLTSLLFFTYLGHHRQRQRQFGRLAIYRGSGGLDGFDVRCGRGLHRTSRIGRVSPHAHVLPFTELVECEVRRHVAGGEWRYAK